MKRFVNVDNILGSKDDILEYNVYLYVSNNPTSNYDDSGKFLKGIWESIKGLFTGDKKH